MSSFSKIVFFISIIALGFVPGGIFISFILLVLYYFPHILNQYQNDSDDELNGIEPEEMKVYSDGTLEEMK